MSLLLGGRVVEGRRLACVVARTAPSRPLHNKRRGAVRAVGAGPDPVATLRRA
jgi:hypothetical protein